MSAGETWRSSDMAGSYSKACLHITSLMWVQHTAQSTANSNTAF